MGRIAPKLFQISTPEREESRALGDLAKKLEKMGICDNKATSSNEKADKEQNNEDLKVVICELQQQAKKNELKMDVMAEELEQMRGLCKDLLDALGEAKQNSGEKCGCAPGKGTSRNCLTFKVEKPKKFGGPRGDVEFRNWVFDVVNHLPSERAEVRRMLELAETKEGATQERYES